MSKTRKMAVTVCAAVAALLFAAIAWLTCIPASVKAEQPDGSATNFQFLSVGVCTESDDSATDTKGAKLAFVINRNLGGNPFGCPNITKDKVIYTQADGETRTLSGIYYKLNPGNIGTGVVPTLIFSFAEDTVSDGKVVYGEGDTLTIQSGFSFKNWDGSDLGINTVSEVTVTYRNGEWTGSFPDSQLTGMSVSVGTLVNGNVTIVDFNLSNPTCHTAYLDKDSGWYASGWGDFAKYVFQDVSQYVMYYTSEGKMEYTRMMYGAGTFGVWRNINGNDLAAPQAGEYILLKKGFILYDVLDLTAGSAIGMALANNLYRPVVVLNQDIAFVYDGSAWKECTPATSAEFTNSAEETAKLGVNTLLPLTWQLSEGANEPAPTFISSDPDIATVSDQGVVLGKATGNVTITAKFLGVTATIDLTVGEEPAKDSLIVTVKNGSTKETSDGTAKKYLVAYAGEDFDAAAAAKNLTARVKYTNGLFGEEIAVTEEMIGSFSTEIAGERSVSVTFGGVSAEAPVWVYTVTTLEKLAANKILTWGPALDFYFEGLIADNGGSVESVNIIQKPEYGVPGDMVSMRTAKTDAEQKTYALHSIGQVNRQQQLLWLSGYNGDNGELASGTVLELKDNYRFYQWIDNCWVAAYRFDGAVSYVWTGSAWADYMDDAYDFTLEKTEYTDVPVGTEFSLNVLCLPAGSYANIVYESSDSGVAEVTSDGVVVAKTAGNVTITVTMGTVKKEISLTVAEVEVKGIVLVNNRMFYVAENGTFDISKVRVKKDYGDGYYGEEITLTPEIASFTLDTTKVGKTQLTVTVKDEANGLDGTVTVNVDVQECLEMYPDNIICADDNTFFGDAIAIYFEKTFPNTANVVASVLTPEEEATIKNYVAFYRGGVALTMDTPNYLTKIMVMKPYIDDVPVHTYQIGDRIVLSAGLTFYKWFGETNYNNVPEGEGDYVKIGVLKYDVTFTYNNSGKFYMEIAPVGGAVKEETVKVGLNAQCSSNVEIIPSYATSGEWFFSSADDSIASVNASGLITGKKIGTTTVTAVLKKNDGETVIQKITFTVNVEDVVQGLEITSTSEIRLDTGAELVVADLIEKFGLKGSKLMASGNKGGEIDLSGARVTGYDPDKTGEQTLTFRVTVDGKSVTGTIKVQVGASGGGCGSASVSLWGLFALAAVLGVCRKKSV